MIVTSEMSKKLRTHAKCVGTAPMFDAIDYETSREALAMCAQCPVQKSCLLSVMPNVSFFDGVCAGVVWRDGLMENPQTVKGASKNVRWLSASETHKRTYDMVHRLEDRV